MTDKITKNSLAEAIFRQIGLPKRQAYTLVQLFFETILQGLKEDKEVNILHFGTFKLQTRKPKLGRNLNTMQPVIIKARKVITFKMHPALRKMINGPSVKKDKK